MYAKVFSQIYDGTLCTKGPWEALVTFQQLLVLADQEGNVDMTASAISRRTTIPIEIIETGITALLLPDAESRTPTENGKRILPLSDGRTWGWRVVNYEHYRQLKREDDRRAYHREYWHKRKLKDSTETQHTQPNQPIAEAEANTEAVNREAKASLSGRAVLTCPHKEILNLYAKYLPQFIQHRSWEGARQVQLKNRWQQAAKPSSYSPDGYSTPEAGLQWWGDFFQYIANDTTLAKGFESAGRTPWKPDLEWITKDANFQKIIDGKYDK